MQDINVVVAFCSRTGTTELLAQNAAVGCVQARGNIRLRWLREEAADESDREWMEHRARMIKEYVAPRDTDAEWLHALIVCLPDRVKPESPELKSFLGWLEAQRAAGRLKGKVASSNDAAFAETLAGFGLTVVPYDGAGAEPREAARLHGRRVTVTARNTR